MLQAVYYTSCCWCYKMCASVTSVRCASELQEKRLYYSTQLSCLPQDSSAKARRPLQGHLLGGTVLYCCLVESSMIDNSNGMMSNNTMHLPTKMYMKPFSQHQTQPSTSEPCWDMNRLKENGWKKQCYAFSSIKYFQNGIQCKAVVSDSTSPTAHMCYVAHRLCDTACCTRCGTEACHGTAGC